MSVFGEAYASTYDATYAAKDYDAECDLIARIFRLHGDGGTTTVLDLGCGTGGHAIRLAERGFRVTGVDRSPQMLARARAKLAAGADLCWIEGDVRTVDAGGPYDVALLMFAVLGYQHTNDDVLGTLENVRRHLRPGGLLVFDVWHGPGAIVDPPGSGARMIQTGEGDVRRDVSSEMDVRHHLCRVLYTLSRGAEDGRAAVARETHTVRYFFPMEIELFLRMAGFELLALGAFDDIERDPDARAWNALVVARAA